ncbi:MAG TPA: 4'-phosphopantetheinyl transferase superfamily protein [Bacteroidales bacterium]|nr:4'-phosphopantetheinyl transferase superfamily protein [Bacteroidales bacterium]
MPVLFTRQPGRHTLLGVWKISETVDELCAQLVLSDTEKQLLDSYKHENRKKHWLSYRVLISKMQNDWYSIHYTDYGKPYLKNDLKSKHISITHSGEFSAVIIDPCTSTGIDIEKINNRIAKVSSRFLSESELQFLDKDNFLEHLTVCWTAKEALFKICGNDFYDFKQEISLFPFAYADNGSIRASLIGEKNEIMNLTVCFERISDYFLSYVTL